LKFPLVLKIRKESDGGVWRKATRQMKHIVRFLFYSELRNDFFPKRGCAFKLNASNTVFPLGALPILATN
jgi:hypothetical protein